MASRVAGAPRVCRNRSENHLEAQPHRRALLSGQVLKYGDLAYPQQQPQLVAASHRQAKPRHVQHNGPLQAPHLVLQEQRDCKASESDMGTMRYRTNGTGPPLHLILRKSEHTQRSLHSKQHTSHTGTVDGHLLCHLQRHRLLLQHSDGVSPKRGGKGLM